jgi:RNA polymerase sigma-70 factor (ECF subfamily)
MEVVYALALGHLGNVADAEDLCAETFCRLYEMATRLNPRTRLRPLLCRICLNLCYDHWRRQGRRPLRIEWGTQGEVSSEDGNPQVELRESVFEKLLLETARRLPEGQRKVFALCHLGGLTIGEAAQVLGCAEGTVRSHLHRALMKLRERLEEAGWGPSTEAEKG